MGNSVVTQGTASAQASGLARGQLLREQKGGRCGQTRVGEGVVVGDAPPG